MKMAAAIILFTFSLAGGRLALRSAGPDAHGAAARESDRVSFVAVPVYLDPLGRELACYQVTVSATAGDVKLVGVEGGESDAFNDAPYYDPRALMGRQVIIGAFTLAQKAPATRTRVATLMFRVTGDRPPALSATIDVAAGPGAVPIQAVVSLQMPAVSHSRVGQPESAP